MKYILLFLLALPIAGSAQKDFNYEFFTTRYGYITEKDTADQLAVYRRIQKENSNLIISSITNTGDSKAFTVEYIGYDPQVSLYIYQSTDALTTIKVDPVHQNVRVYSTGRIEAYY